MYPRGRANLHSREFFAFNSHETNTSIVRLLILEYDLKKTRKLTLTPAPSSKIRCFYFIFFV